jgi:hypothetical protein
MEAKERWTQMKADVTTFYRKYHLPRSGTVVNLICAVSFIRLKKAASVFICDEKGSIFLSCI